MQFRRHRFGTSLAVQWLRLRTEGGLGSIPGQEIRSHMPCSTAPPKKNYSKIKNKNRERETGDTDSGKTERVLQGRERVRSLCRQKPQDCSKFITDPDSRREIFVLKAVMSYFRVRVQ